MGYLTAVPNLSKEENVGNLMLWKACKMLQTLVILVFKTNTDRVKSLKNWGLWYCRIQLKYKISVPISVPTTTSPSPKEAQYKTNIAIWDATLFLIRKWKSQK